jgi:deoxycytidylate deaminase
MNNRSTTFPVNEPTNYTKMIVEWQASKSNCQKRAVVCVLRNARGQILSIGHNSCTPPDNNCVRLHTMQLKQSYTGTECSSTHAEASALKMLREDQKAVRADVYGHEFACGSCEKLLREHGVTEINIIPEGFGTGLRKK